MTNPPYIPLFDRKKLEAAWLEQAKERLPQYTITRCCEHKVELEVQHDGPATCSGCDGPPPPSNIEHVIVAAFADFPALTALGPEDRSAGLEERVKARIEGEDAPLMDRLDSGPEEAEEEPKQHNPYFMGDPKLTEEPCKWCRGVRVAPDGKWSDPCPDCTESQEEQ